jgi:hypothetical protein
MFSQAKKKMLDKAKDEQTMQMAYNKELAVR